MKTQGLDTRDEVTKAIKALAALSTSYISRQLFMLQQNLITLESDQSKIISLSQHRKIKRACLILAEVLADRNGWVTPEERIESPRTRTRSSTRSGRLVLRQK